MGMMLYSDDLQPYPLEVTTSIKNALDEVKSYFQISTLSIFQIDERNIAIPIELDVNLPSRGTYGNIDIRRKESILLIFDVDRYPTSAPRVKSNRKDFPVSELSHLYVVEKGKPPTLCLVRENLDEWFANRRVSDLLIITQQWFSKAANGLLSIDGDEYEPTRLEGYKGIISYKYSELCNIIQKDQRFIRELPFCLLSFTTKKVESNSPSFKYLIQIKLDYFDKLFEIFRDINLQAIDKIKKSKETIFPVCALLVWSGDLSEIKEYSTFLPRTYQDLVLYCKNYLIDIETTINEYLMRDLFTNNITSYIPIIVAIRRPRKLIGFSANIEFLNFVIKPNSEQVSNNRISPEAEVFFQSHREPVSSALSKKLSDSVNQNSTIFIGAGALGSKIIFNYARQGNYNLKVIDNDILSPHNIVRHDLFFESVGMNKAEAVINKIKDFIDDQNSLSFINENIFSLGKESFSGYSWLVDSTASLNVLNWIINNNITEDIPNRAKVEIAYRGMLGFLYAEGNKHNPRLDDLVNYIYFLSLKFDVLSSWLIQENKKMEGLDYDNVDIGIGCSSPTVIMSNDSMSYHGSIFTKILNYISERNEIGGNGLISISFISNDGFKNFTKNILISPFISFACKNNSGWEIRMQEEILRKIKAESAKHKRNETGGILIGLCNYKTKTIHVFDTIVAPPDSKHSLNYFYRGIKNLPEQVRYIKERTGSMIGYIGEWHSHPMGLEILSSIDQAAVEMLKPLNEKYPIPTLIAIMSKENFIPFVF